MGKSPGKWIKTVLFGKKSSKSNPSKDAIINKKTPITAAKPPSKDLDDNSMVISSPVPLVMHTSRERTDLENTSSANLTSDTIEAVTSTVGLNTANEDELIKLEQAAIKAQTAFRGYLARRAFFALKGIIRLQAQVRGRLVRRQAVATLSCMRAIVEFQALARGRRVRLSSDGSHVLQKYTTPGVHVDKKRADFLGTSLRLEKLSTNAFGTKLVASSHSTMPLSIQYDPAEPNSAPKWLHRWSSSHFWEPLPRPKKMPDSKPKRKQTKLQPEEPETGRPKRSILRVPAANPESNPIKSSESEKPKPTSRKASSHQPESVDEHSHNELEKVKRSLRKISVSTEKPPIGLDRASVSPNPDASEPGVVQPFVELNDAKTEPPKPEPEPLPVPPLEAKLQDGDRAVEPPAGEADGNVELNSSENHGSKENQKTRRRRSFPAKQEYGESGLALPSYMAATESAKAKLRAQAVAKAAEDGGENGFIRRHSLPASTGKPSLQSPRVQKPLQANGKGWNKSNKPQIFAREDKMGWKR